MLKALYKVFDGWEALMKDGYKTLIKMRLDGLRGIRSRSYARRSSCGGPFAGLVYR